MSLARTASSRRISSSNARSSLRPALRRASTKAYALPEVNDKTFAAEVLQADVAVLVDFWAPWCGPCRMLEPLVEEIAAEYDGRVKVVKLNTDDSPNVATDYGVRSVPTVMVFKGGKKMDTIIGAVPKSTLVQTVDKFVSLSARA